MNFATSTGVIYVPANGAQMGPQIVQQGISDQP